jgi:hypothetical protein
MRRFALSPDGRELAVELLPGAGTARAYSLMAFPAAGGEPNAIAPLGEFPAYAPDGDLFFAASTPTGARILRRKRGGEPQSIAEVPGAVRSLATDGADVFFATLEAGRGQAVFAVPVEGGAARPLGWPGMVVPAPRGGHRLLLFYDATGAPRGRAIAPDQPLAIDGPTFDARHGAVAWDADGRSFLFVTHGTVTRRFLDGRPDQRLFTPTGLVTALATSPDGEEIYTLELRGQAVRQLITNFATRR